MHLINYVTIYLSINLSFYILNFFLLLCVWTNAGYRSLQRSGSGRSLRYSFNNVATSCGHWSSSKVVSFPQSKSSLNCKKVKALWCILNAKPGKKFLVKIQKSIIRGIATKLTVVIKHFILNLYVIRYYHYFYNTLYGVFLLKCCWEFVLSWALLSYVQLYHYTCSSILTLWTNWNIFSVNTNLTLEKKWKSHALR